VPTWPGQLREKDLNDQALLKRVKEYLGNRAIGDSGQHTTVESRTTDVFDNTVLHILAAKSKPKSVKWVLGQFPELLNLRNAHGETPLDALEFHLEKTRTRLGTSHMFPIRHVSDKFKGFSNESVACLLLLKGLTNPSALDRLRIKYGCTCGQCVLGILSPRMRFALQCAGEMQQDMLPSSLGAWNGGEDFVWANSEAFRFLAPWVRKNLETNQSMRQGFAALCQHFSECVKKGRFPNEENVLDEMDGAGGWPPNSKNFLSRGGTVYSVGSWIFQAAMGQDIITGDGGDTFAPDEDEPSYLAENLKKLPECRNDLEFGFASSMCGYKRVSQIQHVCALTGLSMDM
jgi:hypothetical protein